MKKGPKNPKAKIRRSLGPSRSGSGWRTCAPAPPNPDLKMAPEEVVPSPSSVSPGQMPIISNNNQNTTHNYGGQVLNYNPVTNNVYLTKEEENVVKLIKAAIGHRFAPAALHKIQPEEAGCMPGTRVSILSMFLEWAKNDPMRIFWLAGLAGTGKTSIAVTLCRMLENDPNVVLGGSFFCSRTANVNELTDARCILPTLAVAFAEKSSAFAKALAAEIKADSSSALSPILTLIKPLLQRPLASVASSELPIIFVIDALDECSDENEVKTLLRAISILECETKVKFIVTSRPETHISTSPISSSDQNSILRLHTIDKTQVTEDIRLYITDAFSKQPLQASWYTEADLNLLATHAEGLFIFASTVVTYLLDAGSVKSRAARLRTAIFAINSSKVVTRPLDAMYEFVLEQASNSEMVEPDELETTQKVLNCILTAKMPLSINVLAELLALDSDDLRDSLRRLRSVVHVPDETDQPGLRTVHASFGDYLFERAATKLRFVSALGNEALARGCLKVMVNRLHFNISQSRSSFEPNSQTKPDSVTYSLEYACLQWVYHLADAPQPWVMEHEVDDAFRSRLLFWLEVMSVLRQVQRAGAMLNLAVTLVRSKDVSRFMRDANLFVVSSQAAIKRSAPHIYLSALPFAAESSLISRTYLEQCTGIVFIKTFGIDHHGGKVVMSLAGHHTTVSSMVYLPDGRLATGSFDRTVRIWNTRTGCESFPPFFSQDGFVCSLAVAASGKSLALGTYTGAVCIWNLEAPRKPPRRFLPHDSGVFSVAFSPDESLIASVAADGLRLWRAETGQQVVMPSDTIVVNGVVFSPDGKTMASNFGKKTHMWNISTGSPEAVYALSHDVEVGCICFSIDSTTLAVGLRGSTIQLWNLTTRKMVLTLPGQSGTVHWIQFSPDDRSLVSFLNGGTIHIWNLHSDLDDRGPVVLHGKVGYGYPALSPDGSYFALASDNHTIQIWDAGVGRIWDAGVGQKAAQSFQAHSGGVTSVSVSKNGTLIVSGSNDRSVRIWDADNGEPKLPPLLGHNLNVTCVAISPDNRIIASISNDRTVRLWDVPTGKPIAELGQLASVLAVTFSPDSRWLAFASNDKTVRIWDIEGQQQLGIGPLQCDTGAKSVAFSPDGRTIAAGASYKRIYLWDTDTGQQTCEPLGGGEFITDPPIAFSPIGKHILSGDNAIAREWDIATRRQSLALEGHNGSINSVAYSFDGLAIATCSHDKTVRVWDALTGTCLTVLHGHGSSVESIAFMPGRKLVSGSSDSTIRVWDIEAAQVRPADSSMDVKEVVERRGLQDGWLLDQAGELLLWVPSEYRACLKLPSCRVLIATHRVEIRTEGTLHRGENWTKCWLGDRS